MESWEIKAKFCRSAPCGRQKTCGFYLGTFATPCQNALRWEQEVEGSIAHCQRQMEAPQRKAAGPKKAQNAANRMPAPPRERVFGGEVFELWTGEYGPDPGGHTKAQAQKYAGDLRRLGSYARVVQYGRKYFVYFR